MRPLDAQGYEEVRHLADEAALDPRAALAHAAELRAYRRLHALLKRSRAQLPMLVAREIANLPAPGDLAAWKSVAADGAAQREAAEPGAPDLFVRPLEGP